jgi:glyoxylase-like metal-dependent hydrolase (beta-lactamase superfamily II)
MFFFLLVGCSSFLPENNLKNSIKPIQDGFQYESLIQVQDGHRSVFVVFPEPRSPQGIVLFDAGGSDSEDNPILEIIAEKNYDVADVSHIFLTHEHQSHIKGISLFPNAEIFALSEAMNQITQQGGYVDTSLNSGDIIQVGSHSIEAFLVPGHSDGSSSFLINSTLIMGDSAISYMDETIGTMEEDEISQQSLLSLGTFFAERASDVDIILFSHSGPLYDINALIDYQPIFVGFN